MPTARPPRLEPGMTIGVVAPSSGIRDSRLEAGIASLRNRGYAVRTADHVYDQFGYLAGLDAARGADFTRMFADPSIHAVLCGRGGYGAVRMLDHIDWSVVAANAKPFIGYSDITTLHLAIERHAPMVTFHGPVLTTLGEALSDAAERSFWGLLERPEPFGQYDLTDSPVTALVPGRASGRLAGGCLALLAASVGTPESPEFSDRIVVIEDIAERAYRVDRMLMQLLRAGRLQQAAGFVIGTVTGWDEKESNLPPITLDTVWRDYIVPLGKPAVTGFPFGHVPNPRMLPLGCVAELDASAGSLTILEPAVR
jgi:muramoyltetrapeptide carboxypeptidase